MDDLTDEQKADALEDFKCDLVDEENCSIGTLLHFVIIEYVAAHGCN
jgi:hypothetical protein